MMTQNSPMLCEAWQLQLLCCLCMTLFLFALVSGSLRVSKQQTQLVDNLQTALTAITIDHSTFHLKCIAKTRHIVRDCLQVNMNLMLNSIITPQIDERLALKIRSSSGQCNAVFWRI